MSTRSSLSASRSESRSASRSESLPPTRRRSFRPGLLGRSALLFVLLSAIFAIPSLVAQSQTGSIRGVVRGSDGTIPKAGEVTLVDQRRTAQLDAEGTFVFDDLPPDTYLLVVETATQGHNVIRVDLLAGETVELDVDLHITTHSEEVVVSAGPDARSSLEIATPVQVLSGEDLMLRSRGTLGQTLSEETGVTDTSFAGGSSRPVIRGLEGDRVRILESGLGTGDASGVSPDHAVSLDPSSAERIEIIRGPASLLYGSSAIGGVVNVEDGRVPRLRSSVPLAGQADLWMGTVDDQRGAAVELDGGVKRFGWHLQASLRDADNYTIPGAPDVDEPDTGGDRELENSDFRNESYSLGGSWFFGDAGYIGVSISEFDSDYGIPGGHEHGEDDHDPGDDGDGDDHGEDEDHDGDQDAAEGGHVDMDSRRIDLRGEMNRSFGIFRGLRARVGAVDYEHDELEDGMVATTFLRDSAEGRFEVVQRQTGRLRGSMGIQLGLENLETIGEEAFIPDTDTSNWGVFAFEELTWDRWSLQFGGRIDGRSLDSRTADHRDRNFTAGSASVGGVYRLNEKSSLGLTLARSTKFPNAQELYADGPHLAIQAFEIGNPDLEPESSLGVDVVFRRQEGRVAGEITVFGQDFSDFIFPAFTGEERDGLPVVVFGQTDAKFVGSELDLAVSVWESARRHFDVKIFGDLVRAEQNGTGRPLPRIPAASYGVGLHYHGERFHLMGEVRHRDDQTRVGENETTTPSYTLVNASYSYRFLFQEQIFDLVVRGRNLTNEMARNHVSYVKDTVPLAGRDFGVSVKLLF